MRRWLPQKLMLLLAVIPLRVGAWPVDVVSAVEVGQNKMHVLSAIEWVEVEDPKIASAELLPAGELMLTGKAPGRTLALLYAEGKMAVWLIRVATPPRPRSENELAMTAAKQVCAGMRTTDDSDGPTLSATIGDLRCRAALLELLKTDAFTARQLDLTFSLAALQGQLADLVAGVRTATHEKVDLHYSGAGLVLEGRLTAAEHRKVLWQIFRRSAGRPALEDRTESIDAPGADGGSSNAPQ